MPNKAEISMDLEGTFVGQKISVVRWKPQPKGSLEKADVFVSGSWDNGVNKVCLWKLAGSCGDPNDRVDDITLLSQCPHVGDVHEMQFLNDSDLIVGSGSGDVSMFKCDQDNSLMVKSHVWKGIHKFPYGAAAPCTGVATRGDGGQILTCGEDGRLCILDPLHPATELTIDGVEGSSFLDIAYVSDKEVVSVGLSGYMKLWDLREKKPTHTFVISNTGREPVNSVSVHPGQAHVVATGARDGLLLVWDLRKENYPVSLLEAHNSDMWELQFHPDHPNHLFTCSEDGAVWHWNATNLTLAPSAAGDEPGALSQVCPWLCCEGEGATSRLRITSLLPATHCAPVNSVHVQRDMVVCGTDSEQIWVINIPQIGESARLQHGY